MATNKITGNVGKGRDSHSGENSRLSKSRKLNSPEEIDQFREKALSAIESAGNNLKGTIAVINHFISQDLK